MRPATVCGYSRRQRLDVVVNILTNLAYNLRKIKILGGNQLRPNINIHDMSKVYSILIETDEKIVDLLNIDYETFINTSYLKQGDSNRFTSSRPTDRKKILADLLDLSYYERLESASKQHSRQLQNDVAVQRSVIENKSSIVQKRNYSLKNWRRTKKNLGIYNQKNKALVANWKTII